MGSKGGSMTPVSQTQGFQSSTSTTTPHPEAMAAYQNVLGQASNVAQIPYTPYQGQQVAGFTPDQLAAFQGVRESQGIADPYIQGASGLIGQSLGFADPSRFNASELSRYYNPYQQNVIDATMANMKEMNASQQNQLTGDAIMKGYMGGDRAGIARAELARQQALTNSQTLAGLQQQGYQQAIDQYNKQQQTALGASQTGAYSLGQLGTQAQNATMQGIQALLGTGGMQQQLGQQQLQSAYDQWQQAMNYPYQQTQWNAGITGAIAPNMGGTTTSSGFGQQTQSQPAPSTFNQVAGAGLSALSLLPKIFKDGGRVGYDDGGPILDLAQDPSVPNVWGPNDLDQIARSRWVSADPFDAPSPKMRADGGRMPFGDKGAPWIPTMQLSAARTDYPTPPKVDLSTPNNKAPETGLGALSKGIGSMSKEDVQGIKGGLGRLFGVDRPIQLTGATPESAVGDYVASTHDELGGLYADGGRIALADGGSPYAGWAARGAATGDAGSSLAFNPRPSATSQQQAPAQQQQGFNPLSLLTGLLTGGGEGGFGNLFSMFAPQQSQMQEQKPVGYAPLSLNYNSIDPMTGLYAARSWSPYYMPKYADGGRVAMFRGGEPEDDDEISRYLPALARGESGGEKDPYSAIGPVSRRGDRPYGKYQVMGTNIPVWTKEAGLGELTPQQFLADRDAQEAVARHKFGQYVRQTGSPQEAAAMWLGGPDYKSHPHARDVLGTDVSKYVDTFNRNLGVGGVKAIDNTFRSAPDRRGLARVADSGEIMNDASPTVTPKEERTGLGSMWSPEVQQGLLAAGLGMMASRSPFPGVAIGEGGLRGLQAYKSAQETAAETARKQAEARRYEATLAETKRYHDMLTQAREAKAESGHVGVIGEDEFGQKRYGYTTGPKAGQPLESGAVAPTGAAVAPSPIDWEKTGDEFLVQLPQSMQQQVKAIAEGRSRLPTGMGANNPNAQRLYRSIAAYDPTFDAGNADARVQLRKEFASTSGTKAGGQITAANTAIQHLGELSKAAEELDNYGIPLANAIKNFASSTAGGNVPLVKFKNAAMRFAEEATKFYRGTGGTLTEIQQAEKLLDPNQSPEQLRAAIAQQAELMRGKIEALEQQWQGVMGEKASVPVPKYDIIRGKTTEALDRIDKLAKLKGNEKLPAEGTTPATPTSKYKEGDVAINKSTNEKLVFRGGKWTKQ